MEIPGFGIGLGNFDWAVCSDSIFMICEFISRNFHLSFDMAYHSIV
jgi:hypothetical protein